jgi:queuine tRNA-ribosyltransferase
MPSSILTITHKHKHSMARTGEVKLNRGIVRTPVFMPIGTVGTVKGLTYMDLEKIGFQIILGNTYHLWLRPDMEVFKASKWSRPIENPLIANTRESGLHSFESWQRPILTDSGGFQAWSLSKSRKFTEDGVTFRSIINGDKRFLSPEVSMEIQTTMGSDIALVLDEALSAEVTKKKAISAMLRTRRWAERSKAEFERLRGIEPHNNTLFGIPQGAQFPDLRQESARLTMELDFDGYSIGGVANGGEPEEIMYAQVLAQTEILEDHKPRHLLGVGTPKDIIEMTKRGIDMFDCVYPTRNARHGSLFFWTDKSRLEYESVKIESARFEKDFEPINSESRLEELRSYSKAYLRHLFKAKETLAGRLATLNNLEFYYDLMVEIRHRIDNDIEY